jgi:hypothetical protein
LKKGYITIEQLVACMLCLIILYFSLSVSVRSIKNVENSVSQFDDLSIFKSIVSYVDEECRCAQKVKYINNFYVGSTSKPLFVRKGILINCEDKKGNNQYAIYYILYGGIYREKVDKLINDDVYAGNIETVCDGLKLEEIDIVKVEDKIYIECAIKKHKYRYLISA